MADELPVPIHFKVARPGIPNSFGQSKSDVLFGWLHRPSGKIGARSGVILCNPFGSEENCTYRFYRQLAVRLSSEGRWVMRFDYYGAGNSGGVDKEPGQVRAWLDSIHAAIDTLTETSGVEEIFLFGTRLGATLAVAAAAERAASKIRGVALWSPFDSGGDFCRETLFVKKLTARNSAAPAAPAPSPDTDQEISGFLLTTSTMAELRLVDLLAIRQPPAPRALVVARRAALTESRLVNHFRSLGVETSHEFIPGLAETLVAPDQSVIPAHVIDRIANWVRESSISEPVRQERESYGIRLTGGRAAAELSSRVAVDDAVCETLLRFGRNGSLFGILTEARHPEAGRRLAIILINPGAVHHCGANRLHVVIARQCAKAGYPVLRFDFSGLGDSPAAENSAEGAPSMREAVLEDERRGIVTQDIVDAMNALEEARGLDRFVLFGNCSAGRMAFHATVGDPRAVGAQLINTPYFDVQDSLQSERTAYASVTRYRQLLSQWETWSRVFKGQVDLKRAINAMRIHVSRGLQHTVMRGKAFGHRLRPGSEEAENPTHAAQSPVNEICDRFLTLSGRSVYPMLVYSPGDVGIGYLPGLLGDTLHELGIRIEIVSGADHDFSYHPARALLIELLTEYVHKLAPHPLPPLALNLEHRSP